MAGEAAALKLEETAESPPPVNDDMTITLTAPVMAHGERLKALTFRQPICSDIMQIDEGWPVRIDYVGQQVIPCPKPMGELLSILAAVPPSTVRALKGIDFPYLLSMVHDSFMSRPNTIVCLGGKMDLAMQLVFTPMIWRLMERRKQALRS
jgi:hypothetical protein